MLVFGIERVEAEPGTCVVGAAWSRRDGGGALREPAELAGFGQLRRSLHQHHAGAAERHRGLPGTVDVAENRGGLQAIGRADVNDAIGEIVESGAAAVTEEIGPAQTPDVADAVEIAVTKIIEVEGSLVPVIVDAAREGDVGPGLPSPLLVTGPFGIMSGAELFKEPLPFQPDEDSDAVVIGAVEDEFRDMIAGDVGEEGGVAVGGRQIDGLHI